MDDTTHELFLRLAGRVDDDLLADARELVAVGEDGHALELVTAALAADGTPLPSAVRAELVTAAAAARIDLDAESALAPAAPDTTAHRFSATADADVPVVAAVRELPNRLRDGVRLRLAWRQTPAGPAPTPLPQPVLLVETAADGRPGEVLAYQVGAAMARAGVHVAVEVLTSGRPLTGYHAAALRDSTPLTPDAPPRAASPAEKVESVVAEVVQQVTASHRPAPPAAAAQPEVEAPPEVEAAPEVDERTVDLFAVDDEPAPRPIPMRTWQSGRRRGFGEQVAEPEADDVPEPTDRSPLPSPVPLARRTRPRPVEAVAEADPLVDPIPQEHRWSDEWESGEWAVGGAVDGPDGSPHGSPGAAGPTSPTAGAPATADRAAATSPGSSSSTTGPLSLVAGARGPATGPHSLTEGPGPQPSPAEGPHERSAGPQVPTAGPHSSASGPHGLTNGPRPSSDAGPHGLTNGPQPSPAAGRPAGPHRPADGPHRPSAAAPVGAEPQRTDPGPYAAAPQTSPADEATAGSHALFTNHPDPAPATNPHEHETAPVAQPAPERSTSSGPAHALAEPPTGPLPVVSPPMAEALLKPESLARLSDADRELLTRLQAELAGGAPAHEPHGTNGAGPA